MKFEMTNNQKHWTVLFATMLVIDLPVFAFVQIDAGSEEGLIVMPHITAWTSL